MEDDTRMAQEDENQNCNNSGGRGRSSKKPKPKKVPQRGLGVAQLEKIRLEEQQKKDAAAILSSQCSSLQASTKFSSYISPVQNNHSIQPSSLVPLASGSSDDFRSPVSMQHRSEFEHHWVPPSGGYLGNGPKLCGSEFDLEQDKFVADPRLQLQFFPRFPILSFPQNSYHQPSPSMVNVSSETSSTPRFPIEPPSNQNHSGNIVPETLRPEEKIIGVKRPYPFFLDVPSAPLYNYKMVPTMIDRKTNASTSCGSGSGFSFDAGNSTLREAPSYSASNSEPYSRKSSKENENFNGDFLMLAPPTPTSCPPPTPTSCPSSRFKSSSAFSAFHNHENPEFEFPSSQVIMEGQARPPPPPEYNRFNQQSQPSLYCFFPLAPEEAQNGEARAKMPEEAQDGLARAKIQNGHEVEESIDLDLKL